MTNLSTTGAANFYYFGTPSTEIKNPTFPRGQKITTQLPANVVKIRILAVLLVTARVIWIGLTRWNWPVAVLGATYALYTTYKHLISKDPLVEVFYKIAGGQESYNNLHELKLNIDEKNVAVTNSTSTEKSDNPITEKVQEVSAKPNKETEEKTKKTFNRFDNISWEALEHPVYRFTTQDGRKGMLVKGLSYLAQPDLLNQLLGAPPAQTKAVMVFIEKLSLYDLSPVFPEWFATIAIAICLDWEPPLSKLLVSSSGSSEENSWKYETKIYASITTDMANEFIAQKGVFNQLKQRIEEIIEVEDDNKNAGEQPLPQVRDVDQDQ
jgi:hypothetical protein